MPARALLRGLSIERVCRKKSRLPGLRSACYTHDIPRPGRPEPTADKETEALMTATFFWKLFAQTGSIDAYMAYRQIPPVTTSG
jgi:hypothetical protein